MFMSNPFENYIMLGLLKMPCIWSSANLGIVCENVFWFACIKLYENELCKSSFSIVENMFDMGALKAF